MTWRMRRFGNALLMALLLAMAFTAGVLADRMLVSLAYPDPTPVASGPNFSLIHDAWDVIDKVYVDRSALRTDPLTYGAIEGMVSALGDTGHSTFLSPEMAKAEQKMLRGQYAGVGLEIGPKNGFITVVAPIDNSPASKAGIHAGDEILKVDGSAVTHLPLQEVVQKISGPAGTRVTLDIYDPHSHQTSSVTLTRARIQMEPVSWRAIPGTTMADLRLSAFSTGTTQKLRDALREIAKRKSTGIVLDLRNNPGGELREAVGVASQFLSTGNVLQEKNTEGAIKAVPVETGGLALSVPLVVLVNGGTASAAEIVAGAIQDAKRGMLVGERTFGTGTVLAGFQLPGGSELFLAVREWLTPNGRTIWHTGIAPDVSVALLPNAERITPGDLGKMSPEQFQATSDAQLLKAVQMLQGTK